LPTDKFPAATWCFTHVDPFEDTESSSLCCPRMACFRFTHVDPFEDTERRSCWYVSSQDYQVSPTSIRSRILKALINVNVLMLYTRFTHVDPFEDTESSSLGSKYPAPHHVSPTSIRSRILKGLGRSQVLREDYQFHPRRSVRGY